MVRSIGGAVAGPDAGDEEAHVTVLRLGASGDTPAAANTMAAAAIEGVARDNLLT